MANSKPLLELTEDSVLYVFGKSLIHSGGGFKEIVTDNDSLRALVADDADQEKWSRFMSKATFEEIFVLRYLPLRINAIKVAGWGDVVNRKLIMTSPEWGDASVRQYYITNFLGALLPENAKAYLKPKGRTQ